MILEFPCRRERPKVEIYECAKGVWLAATSYGATDPNPRGRQFQSYHLARAYAEGVADVTGFEVIDWGKKYHLGI